MAEELKIANPLKMALEWTGAGGNVMLVRFKDTEATAGPVNTSMMRLFFDTVPAGLACLLYAEAGAMVLECGDAASTPDAPEAFQMAEGEYRATSGFAVDSGLASDGAF